MSIVDQVIRALRPTRVVSVGDFADAHNVSRHIKDPEMRMPFVKEVDGAKKCRARIDEACAAANVREKAVTLGNHEDRLRKLVAEHAPALEGIVPTMATLLEFELHGWKVYDYGEVYRIGSLHVTHDLNTAGVYAHERSRVAMGGSTLIGHTHRMAVATAGTHIGGRHVAAMFGWLGDDRFAKYHKRPLRQHWQLGFGVGWLDMRTGYATLQPVPIVQYRAVVAGVLYEPKSTSRFVGSEAAA